MTDDLAERQARDTAALAREIVVISPGPPLPCTWGDDAWHRAAKLMTRAFPSTWRRLLAEERAKTRAGEQP